MIKATSPLHRAGRFSRRFTNKNCLQLRAARIVEHAALDNILPSALVYFGLYLLLFIYLLNKLHGVVKLQVL